MFNALTPVHQPTSEAFEWVGEIPKTSPFQRNCEGVEHVLEEERQVQAEHPAKLPVLLPAGRPAENCES